MTTVSRPDVPRAADGSAAGDSGDPALVEALLRDAGGRTAVDPDRQARVREAARQAWRDGLRARRRRRWLGAAALAAAVLVAAVVWTRRPATPAGADADDRVVRTAADERAVRPLGDGRGEWRLDERTTMRVDGPRAVALVRGAIYFDDQGDAGAPPVTVTTPIATITDLGTRFEVRIDDERVTIAVREGRVHVTGPALDRMVAAGARVVVAAGGAVTESALAPDDPSWSWTRQAAGPPPVDGLPLGRFLDWACREGGWTLEFSRDVSPERVRAIVLHGSIDGLSLEDAVTTMLLAAGLEASTSQGRLVVRPGARR
ncbi:MAG: FecR family protein [Vicinamibacterales bacterium]